MRAALFILLVQATVLGNPTILYEKDPTLLTTTVQMVVLAGHAEDPIEKKGLANFVGELVLRGTKKQNRSVFQSDLERLGAALGVSIGHDKVVFSGSVIKENSKELLTMLKAAVLTPGFRKKEFIDFRRETLAEISHMKNSNVRLGGLALRKELMMGTPLEFPGIGTQKTVKAIKLADVLRFYKTYLNQANTLFAVASPHPETKINPTLIEIWKGLPKGEKTPTRNFSIKTPKTPKLIVVDKKKTSTGSMMLGQSGIIAQDPRRYALGVGNFAFGGEPLICRLFRIVRSQLGWTYSIGSTYRAAGRLSNQKGFFVISSTPSIEFTGKTLSKILSLWKEYLSGGVTSDELKLAKDSLVNSYPFNFDSAKKRLWHKLREHIYKVPTLTPDEYAKKINGLSNSDIKKALAETQSEGGWIISIVADKKVIDKQLVEAQKDIAKEKRLRVSKVYLPDQLVE